MKKYIIGVDEAGRGPLAGPVAVGAVCVPNNFDWKLVEGVRDSKKMTEKKREAVYIRTQKLRKEGVLNFSVSKVSAGVIDRVGIARAVALALTRAIRRLGVRPNDVSVKLDGLLSAPSEFLDQETIIGGDDLELVISLASVMAKVTRDRYMVRTGAHVKYLLYEFARHKGYGTQVHQAAIRTHGLSEMHRKSFCRNLQNM